MKVCFIVDTIAGLGGVQRVLSVLASEFSEHYEVDILCTEDKFKIDRKIYNINHNINIKVNSNLSNRKKIDRYLSYILKEINRISGVFNNKYLINILKYIYYPINIQNKTIQYLNSQNYDVVIGVQGYHSLLLGIISNKLKSKIIGWQHNSYDAYFNTKNKYYWNLDKLFEKYLTKLNKCVVLTVEDSIKYKKNFNVNSEVIYNPLSFCSDLKSKCNNKSIIFVGRLLEQQKGLDLLIEAFSLVHKKNKNWILKIVGDGPDRTKLVNHINKYNLRENILLIGKSEDIKQHYLDSSIFVSSSRWEGFGLVLTEAMECGLPVVSFANSGPKEIINKDRVNGILVQCHNTYKLAESINELIDNKDKRKLISSQSIKRAQDFNVKKIFFEWEKILTH